jgi:short-subunit dehydrogenase
MKRQTWVILGATSIIAEEFAHLAAKAGYALLLIGRQKTQLDIIASDITLRHHVHCDVFATDLSKPIDPLLKILDHHKNTLLFIAHSFIVNNEALTDDKIVEVLNVNVVNTSRIIHAYWHKKQHEHRLIFLSSVAACKGRAKNSLYGASKRAIEIYLEGLQQEASSTQHITIARLGFIDTHMTYGERGIFYASPPKACAKACWKASYAKKRKFYHPGFWRFIMGIISILPFFAYKKMRGV